MTRRYFADSPITGCMATLAGAEAHHLLHVMRATTGTEVVLFDGTGVEFTARVEKAGRKAVALRILSRADVDRELPFLLTLGVALPKGDRQRWLVEKAVELGVTRLVPLETEKSAVRVDLRGLGRLRRTVVEGSKQCGRNRLLEIAPPRSWSDYVGHAPEETNTGRPQCLVAHRGGPPLRCEWPAGVRPAAAGPVFLAVGPEGGLTDDEIHTAVHAGWALVGLGPRVLRVETAAVALVTLAALEVDQARMNNS